jgi:tetratricopeptide (TPR) repeat protein
MRAAVIAAVLACASSAGAQPAPSNKDKDKDKAAAAFADGQKDYAAGKYAGAAVKFEAAYALDPDPAYLFNIAQAYRFDNACAAAAAAYRRFLAIAPDAPNAAKVKQFIEQSDECAKTQAPVTPVEPPRPPPERIEPVVPPPPERPSSSSPGRGQRIAGVAVGASGLVGLGLAAYFTYEASDYTSQREALCANEIESTGTCVWTVEREQKENALDDQGKRAQLLARLSWGIGGAALVGGVVLYLLAPRASGERAAVTIAPSQGGAMAYGTIRF